MNKKLVYCLALAGAATASQAQTTPQDLDDVVITASPIAEPFAQSMRSTTTITREDIERSAASTLNEVLADLGGLDIQNRGVPGVQADVSIRGSNFEQTLVLVDGFPISNPQTAHHNLNIPIPLPHIERIEIVKGPGAIQYGGTATAGVINIITRTPANNSAEVQARYGSHNSRELTAFAGGAVANTRHGLSVSATRVDSEHSDQPTDADLRQATYTGNAAFDAAEINWGLAAEKKDFGAWGFYSDAYPDAREKTEARQAWSGINFDAFGWDTDLQAYWRWHKDYFITYISGAGFINNNKTQVSGAKLTTQRHHHGGTTALGSNLKYEHIKSDTYAYDNGDLVNEGRNKTSFWLFRHQDLTDQLSAETSINHVNYSRDSSFWLPSFALAWQFDNHWHGYASWARSARTPTYLDLYSDTSANEGNPNLKAETSDNYEIGLKGKYGQHKTAFAVFERKAKNLIEWTRDYGTDTFYATNLNRQKVQGFEADWQWQPQRAWLDRIGVNYEYLHTEYDADNKEVKYAANIPRQTLRTNLGWTVTPQTHFDVTARLPKYRQQSTKALLSAKLGWQGEHLNAFLEGRNLLNKEVVETGFAPAPGRWLYTGVGLRF